MSVLHVCLALMDCLFMLPLQTEEVLSPRNPGRHHATGWVLCCCGVGVWVYLVPSGALVRGHYYT